MTAGGGGASVLLVDDDPGTLETLRDILETRRFRVATAASGEAAVAMASARPYDAVLMDIVMPGLGGVDALRAIKAHEPRTPVIMMTAFTRDELVADARRATAVAVLAKPLEMDRLLALLERVTAGGAPPREEPR
ncbi:MAG: response regulator [Candidatus Rokubacteria bacterium]|nr:response regulator [Candidatus Rokubacteria bacterium]